MLVELFLLDHVIIVMVRKKRKWWCFIFGNFSELYFDEDDDDDDADDDGDDQEPEVVAEVSTSHEFKQEAHWLSHCTNLQITMTDKDHDGYDHDYKDHDGYDHHD